VIEGGLLIGRTLGGFGFSFALFGRDGRFLGPKRLEDDKREVTSQC